MIARFRGPLIAIRTALDASAAIDVTKTAAGIEAIAHSLLERLGVGEAAIRLTLQIVVPS